MNKNFENYKATYSALRPSDEAVERIMNMTNESKRVGFRSTLKRVTAAALALALVIGGGAGIHHFTNERDNIISNEINDLTVLVAYADSGQDYQSAENIEKNNSYQISSTPWYDEGYTDEKTGAYYGRASLELALSLEDYTDVDTLKVSVSSGYGYVGLGYYYTESSENGSYSNTAGIAGFVDNDIVISGDDIRHSQEIMQGMTCDDPKEEAAWKREAAAGYYLAWNPLLWRDMLDYDVDFDLLSPELLDIINSSEANDRSLEALDLSQIKDTVTFTVTFKDGTVKTADISFYFDSNGYMHFES